MTRTRRLLLLAAASLALVAGLFTGNVRTASPAHAATTGTSVGYITWHHNPANQPNHWVELSFDYTWDLTGALGVFDVDLSCGGTATGLWGSGNNVNGTLLDWGAEGSGGDYNVKWSAPFGGNIPACTRDEVQSTGSATVNTATRIPMIRYHFTTNYGSGQPNDTVAFNVGIYSGTHCEADLVSGPGSFTDTCNAFITSSR